MCKVSIGTPPRLLHDKHKKGYAPYRLSEYNALRLPCVYGGTAGCGWLGALLRDVQYSAPLKGRGKIVRDVFHVVNTRPAQAWPPVGTGGDGGEG